jgi:hypothetical protein
MLTFIESPIFSRLVYDYLDDDEYGEFQLHLAANPAAGQLPPGHVLRALKQEFVDEAD